MVVGLAVGIWVARYLGPEQFGLLSYAQSFVALFATIATLGLNGIVVRELVNDVSRKDEIIGTAFWLKLAGALCVLAILAIAVNFTSNDTYTNALIYIIASATIFQSFNVIDYYFQSIVLSKFVVYANSIALFVSSVTKILLILTGAPLMAFAWVAVLDGLILSSGLTYFFLKNNQTFAIIKLRFNIRMAVRLLKDSWPLILSGVVISIYMKIDQIMIKEMIGAEAVGQYAAAVRISEAWYFIPMVIASSLFPAVVNARNKNKDLYYGRLQSLYDIMVWMAIAIAVPVTFAGDWIVDFLYGDEYGQAANVLVIHIWAGVFVFIGVAFSNYLVAENLTKKSLYRTSFGAVVNIALNLIWIPAYGIEGAACATLIGQIASCYLFDLLDKELYGQLKLKTKSLVPVHVLGALLSKGKS